MVRPAQSSADTEKQLRLFVSFDVVGSTSYKKSHGKVKLAELDRKGRLVPFWANAFATFYLEAHQILTRRIEDEYKGESAPCLSFLKAIGDEVVYSAKLRTCSDATNLMKSLLAAVKELCQTMSKQYPGLSVKSTAWTAGFPITDYIVESSQGVSEPADVSNGKNRQHNASREDDYIGPSMDCGFRLAKFASPQKLAISVDLAYILLKDNSFPGDFLYEGRHSLPGVLDNKPYPVILIKTKVPDDAERVLLNAKNEPAERDLLLKFCDKFLVDCERDTWLVRPYIEGDLKLGEIPLRHSRIYQQVREDAEKARADGNDKSSVSSKEMMQEVKVAEKVARRIKKKKASKRTKARKN